MKRVLLSILTVLMIVATTLSAMVIVVRATLYVTAIESPLPRAGAIAAEIVAKSTPDGAREREGRPDGVDAHHRIPSKRLMQHER